MATAYVRHKSGLIRTSQIQDIAHDAAFGGRINVVAAGVEVEVVEMAAIEADPGSKKRHVGPRPLACRVSGHSHRSGGSHGLHQGNDPTEIYSCGPSDSSSLLWWASC